MGQRIPALAPVLDAQNKEKGDDGEDNKAHGCLRINFYSLVRVVLRVF